MAKHRVTVWSRDNERLRVEASLSPFQEQFVIGLKSLLDDGSIERMTLFHGAQSVKLTIERMDDAGK